MSGNCSNCVECVEGDQIQATQPPTPGICHLHCPTTTTTIYLRGNFHGVSFSVNLLSFSHFLGNQTPLFISRSRDFRLIGICRNSNFSDSGSMAFLVTSLIFAVIGIIACLCTVICFNRGPSVNLYACFLYSDFSLH